MREPPVSPDATSGGQPASLADLLASVARAAAALPVAVWIILFVVAVSCVAAGSMGWAPLFLRGTPQAAAPQALHTLRLLWLC